MQELRRLIGEAIGNIERFNATVSTNNLLAYDNGRYDAYQVVLGWIDSLYGEAQAQ